MKICPKCSTIIQNPEAHFCYNCGEKLPAPTKRADFSHIKEKDKESNSENLQGNKENLVSKREKKQTVLTVSNISDVKKSRDDLSKKWFNFVIGINILAASFLIVTIGLYFRSIRQVYTNKISPTIEINSIEVDTDIFGEDTPSNLVLSLDFYSIVPQQPLFYIEGGNLQTILNNILNKDEIKYLEETYKTPIKELLTFTNNQFAYVKNSKKQWAIITSPASVDFFERAFSNYQKNKKEEANIITARIGKYLVFSNSQEYLNEIRSASDKTILTINKDSRFTSKVSKAPKNSLFFAYTFSDTYAKNGFLEDLRLLNMENIYADIKGIDFKSFAMIKNNNKFEIVFID